jgi:hypothetical protein
MREAVYSAQKLASSGNSRESNWFAHAYRNGLFCALIVGAFLLATYPVAEMGIIDDWSYTKTALDFARTGHLLYNGAGAPMLGWQVMWAALFIKLFGFSFTIVRFSILPIAMASVYLFHQILMRFEIAPRLAVFGALTLGLSPLFVPLATSFMNDVPGLFVVLLCIYTCQRAVAAESDHSALMWLCSAVLLNLAGGTVRQIAWLGALVMAPSTAWLLCKRRGIMAAAILMWIVSVFVVIGCLHWVSRQPYSVSEPPIVTFPIHPAIVFHLMALLAKALLCLLLVLLPVLIATLVRAHRLRVAAQIRIVGCLLALLVIYLFLGRHGKLEGNIMPWLTHVIASQGILPGRSTLMLGSRTVTISLWMRIVISLIVVAAGMAFVEQMIAKQWLRRAIREKRSSWRELFWILGPFALSYLAILLLRGIQWVFFDRYLLPLMAVAIIVLLRLYQQEIATGLPPISWAILGIFALYTVAATHDWFALDRARVLAAGNIQQAGVPRTAIQGGLEYDAWTQIRNGGHVNNSFIKIPKGAYNPNVLPLPLAPDCQLPYSTAWPSVKPKYFLTTELMDCLAQSTFSPVYYRAWLPPFHRTVYIQQLPAGSK